MAGSVVAVALLVAVFTFFPVLKILIQAVQDNDGAVSLAAFCAPVSPKRSGGSAASAAGPAAASRGTRCSSRCCAASSRTALGLAFALIARARASRTRRLLRVLSVLPIITPPFVIGLGLILLFGRSGLVNQLVECAFGIPGTRWIYGYQGVLLAQVFAFTPIAFLVLIGVVEGVSPSMEEAAQTLRASRWRRSRRSRCR